MLGVPMMHLFSRWEQFLSSLEMKISARRDLETETSRVRKYEAECILDYIGRDSRRILDLGCNLGYFTSIIKKCNPQASVCGADINRRVILQAKKTYRGLDFYLADDDFFLKHRFDTIVMM